MKSKRRERKRKRLERRRRYKKKEQSHLLRIKIALICYTTIFGISYLTSDTIAYIHSESEVSGLITAGTWEIPEEIVELIDPCSEAEETVDADSEADCERAGDEPVDENGQDDSVGEEEAIDLGDEDIDELEDEKGKAEEEKEIEKEGDEESADETGNMQPKPDEDIQQQPVGQEETVDKPKEQAVADPVPTNEQAPEKSGEEKQEEPKATVIQEDNNNVEGELSEKEETIEVGE